MIFRSSNFICAGYEIGWEYVESVNSSKQTFSGFVSCMTGKYKRKFPATLGFMSAKSFISWWFSWASHMNIDFRENCNWCGPKCDALACDGTKVGLGFKNSFVVPIEHCDSDDVIRTERRRFDRTLIRNQPGTKESEFAKTRKLLRDLSGKIIENSGFHDTGFINDSNGVIPFLDSRILPFFLRVIGEKRYGNVTRTEQVYYYYIYIYMR